MTRNNFGLWLYYWYGDGYSGETYIIISKLRRLFMIACDEYNVDKFAYDTPEKFRHHLESNGADSIIMKALDTAVGVWASTSSYLQHVYSSENYDNWP